MKATADPDITISAPRRFTSIADAAASVSRVAGASIPLVRAYRGNLDPALRERVMVAVSEANECAGCSQFHQRLAVRAGVSDEDLEALGLGDLAGLDERSRTAIVYAVDRSLSGFAGEPPPEVLEAAAGQFTDAQLEEIEAVARVMTLANLTVGTARALRTRLPVLG